MVAFQTRLRLLLVLIGLLGVPPLLGQTADLAAKAQKGKLALAAGKYDEATSIYAELVKTLPENAGLRMNLGMACHLAGRDRQAVEHLRAALKLDANLLPAKLFLGVSEMRLGHPRSAVGPLSEFLKAQPNHKNARGMLADALSALERYGEAASQFRKLAGLTPKDPRVWYALGHAYQSLTEQTFDEIESKDPESPYFLVLVAETRASQQEYSGAFYLYRQGLARKPDMRGMHVALAEVYRQTDHLKWAASEEAKEKDLPPLDCARDVLECAFHKKRFVEVIHKAQKSDSIEALYWRARAADELAREAFGKLEDLPESVERRRFRAEVLTNQGRHLDAAEQLRAALQLSPHNPEIQMELVSAYHQVRECGRAQPLLDELLRRIPDDPKIQYLQGACLLSTQQAAPAIPWLEKAAARAPEMLDARLSLGRAYLQAGQPAKAIPHLEAALPLDTDGSLHYQLARAYQQSGRRDEAALLLRKYREIQQQVQTARREIESEVKITAPE